MKILIAYKSTHWFCSACEATGGSAISNAKYNSPDATVNQRFAEAMDNAMASLQETVKKLKKLSYGEIVKKFDCNLKKIAVEIPAPTAITSAVPNQTADLRELQERQER